jgi:paraquat-inducible protein A
LRYAGTMLRLANLALLILFPVAWFAPLLRAGLLPLFGLSEISVVTGLQSLWRTDVALALLVTVLAIFVPWLKTLGLALLHFGLLSPRALPTLHLLGRLAMADVFLIALYVVVVKGVGLATVEVAWGLYLFTACILASLVIGWKSGGDDGGRPRSQKGNPRFS